MQFRDLRAQYQALKAEIDAGMAEVLASGQFILGRQVTELEARLAQDVNRAYCVTCANGTDALVLTLMLWGIGPATRFLCRTLPILPPPGAPAPWVRRSSPWIST